MFRRGGSTNMNGIMDGIIDRQDYANGSDDKMPFMHNEVFYDSEGNTVPYETFENMVLTRQKEAGKGSAPSIRNDSEPSYEEKVRKIMEDYESKRVNPIYKLLTQGGLKGMKEEEVVLLLT